MTSFVECLAHFLPRVMFPPTLFASVFALYVIFKKSPASLGRYKYILLGSVLASLQFDLIATLLVQPNPMPKALGAVFVGLLAQVTPAQGRFLGTVGMASFMFEFIYIVVTFISREHFVTKDSESRIHFHIRVVQLMLISALGIVCTPYTAFIVMTEENARIAVENITMPCTDCAIYVVESNSILNALAFIVMMFCIFFITFIWKTLFRINKTLNAHRQHMSGSTLKMQKMLIRALMWQTVIPLLFMGIPGILLVCVVYDFPRFQAPLEPTEHGQKLTSIVFAMPSTFSIMHIFCMLYFTTPYKRFCLRILKIQKTEANLAFTVVSKSDVSIQQSIQTGKPQCAR